MRLGYKQSRQCILVYRIGPRNGIKEYFGGFMDLEDLEDYCTYIDEPVEIVDLEDSP